MPERAAEDDAAVLMRAVALDRYGPPEVLAPARLPRPDVGPDTVLVRVGAAGVNPADWRFRSGQFRRGIRLRLPWVPGSDLAGEAVGVGAEVRDVGVGDLVHGMTALRAGGGYAEFAALPRDQVAPVPAGLSVHDAAAVPLAGLTALQALRDQAGVRPGEEVLVNGASGGVGSFAVQIAVALGARVTAVSSARNHEFVRSLGASDVLDHRSGDPARGPQRFDVVLDAVDAVPYRRWRAVLRRRGRVVTVNPVVGRLVPDWLTGLEGGRRLRSVFVRPSGPDLEVLAGWIRDGRVVPRVQRTFDLAEAADAHRLSEGGRVRGKLVLRVDAELAGRTA